MTKPPAPACPYHGPLTRRPGPDAEAAPVTTDPTGTHHVRSFAVAREVLRGDGVRQAGFMAEFANGTGVLKRPPVLFAEGEAHHEMRRGTARLFTPTRVEEYRPFIARLADDLIADLARRGEVDLDDLALRLAVGVAARVVGLTDSLAPGMERRVTGFADSGGDSDPRAARPSTGVEAWRSQAELLLFHALDVLPAIRARRRERRDDLISHLLDKEYSDLEILTECLTYGVAGMVTTREFVSAAAWHLLRDPDLRADYVHGTEPERHAILHEILRLEPVVTTLYRRAERDLDLGGHAVKAGDLLALDVQRANSDPGLLGSDPLEVCPARPLPRGVAAPVLAFGDGHHRCPGAFLAIKESDVFLRRLLMWRDLRIVREPTVAYNEVVKGYELRGFRIALG